jgi:tetratricopeptide (TPR) repeat protein
MGAAAKIFFAGNCQALALGSVYARHIAPLLNQTVTILDLYPGQPADRRQQRLEELRAADIVAEQIFDPPRLVPPNTLAQGTRRVTFPTVAGVFFWPFSHPHPGNRPGPLVGGDGAYPGEIGCRQLNRLIEQGLPVEEAAVRYANMDLAGLAHLDRVLEMHLERQQQRDDIAGLATHDYILARLRTERLFITPGHPTLGLYRLVAEGLFDKLGVPYSLIEAALRAQRTTPFPLDEAPVHPSVAAHLGLGFIDANTTYRYRNEGSFSFAAYTRRYLTYQWDANLAEGMQLTHTNQAARAIPLLKEGLRACPGSAAGWRTLGLALSGEGETQAAIEAASRAIALDPADPEGQATAAHIWLRAGNLAEAESCARAAIRTFPLWPGSHRTLAHILAGRGAQAGALATARWACDLAPGDPQNAAFLKNFGQDSAVEQAPAPRALPVHASPEKYVQPKQDSPMTGISIDFGVNGAGHGFLRQGWSHPEPDATWTQGMESTIDLPNLEPERDYALRFSVFPAGSDSGHAQRAIFSINGSVVANLILRFETTLELLVPSAVFEGNTQATLRIALPDAISPAQMGMSADPRLLALSFQRLTFRPFLPTGKSLVQPG